MDEFNALQLADFILANYPGKGITPMKLQKLAYYTKVWTLVAGKRIVIADFEKWEYGPVNQDIYHAYKSFGGEAISLSVKAVPSIQDQNKKVFKFILDNYVNYSAFALSAMTHNEDPWMKTSQNQVITDELILDYYSKQSFAKNFNDTDFGKGPFHVVQSDSWHAFTLDMDIDEATEFGTFSSYEDFLEQSEQVESESKDFFEEIFN